jgi:hypothetical protein
MKRMKTNEKAPKKAQPKAGRQTWEEEKAGFDQAKADYLKKHGDKLPKVH